VAVFFASTDSTTAANDGAPSDTATTTNRARATGPAPTAKGSLGWRPPPEDRGVFDGKGGSPDHTGRLGVA
jgi:hypothetical protein